MDQQQTETLQQAQEQWTDAAQQSFQVLADRMVAVQESNLRLTQSFFQNWLEQVHGQTQDTLKATQSLQEQGQRQREAFETLSGEATNVYSEFLNSTLSFYQETLNTASQAAQSNIQRGAQATQQSSLAVAQAFSQAGQQAMKATREAVEQTIQATREAAQQVAQILNESAQNAESSNGGVSAPSS